MRVVKVWTLTRVACKLFRPICGKLTKLTHLQVCDNVGDHLIGNVYARYEWETEAQAAVDNLNDRWYAGMLCSIQIPFIRLLTSCN